MNADVIGASVAGQPVVYISGFIVLVLLAFVPTVARSLVTVTHEGGHVVMAVLTGRGPQRFRVNEGTGGGMTTFRGGWGVGLILIRLAGYLSPPMVGLAGVVLVLDGKAWSVLWASLVLLLAAFFQAEDLFTMVIVLLAGAGIGWVAVAGSPRLQAGVAVGLIWLLLIGVIITLVDQGLGREGSDAAELANDTWIPAFVWAALFWFVAIVCLWVGARRLLAL